MAATEVEKQSALQDRPEALSQARNKVDCFYMPQNSLMPTRRDSDVPRPCLIQNDVLLRRFS